MMSILHNQQNYSFIDNYMYIWHTINMKLSINDTFRFLESGWFTKKKIRQHLSLSLDFDQTTTLKYVPFWG